MKDNIIQLVNLQKLDNKISKLKKVEQEGPLKIEKLSIALEAAQVQMDLSLAEEEEARKKRRALETEMSERAEKIRKNNARQFQIKNNEEYRALLKEVDYLKKSNHEAEENLLELLEIIEKLSQENEKLGAQLEDKRKELDVKIKEVEAWMAVSNKELNACLKEKEVLVQSIPKNLLSNYNRVFTRRDGRAVVSVVSGVCQECHMHIPPQEYNELQRNDRIMTCAHCNRIIYWKDHEDYEGLDN